MPTVAVNPRPRRRPVQPRAAIGPALLGVAKTAATSAAMTAVFGGVLEVLMPHGKPDARRVTAAMKMGGGIGGGVAAGVALPHAVALATGIPLGVVIGTTLMGAWIVVRNRQKNN